MFSPSVRSALVTLVFAAFASAAPGLSLSLSGPTEVTSVGALHVVATLVNTGDEELKLLNDPRTVLHTFETDTFAITDATGASPAFKGALVKYVPERVVAKNQESSFTVLAPGASVAITHDRARTNFTASGAATYDIAAANKFQYVDPATSALVTIFADHADTHNRRHLRRARRVPDSAQTTTSARFVTWFGTFTSAHHTTILSHYTKMKADAYSAYTYDCSCTDSDTYAYVYPDEFGTIYLCGVFWEVSTTGTDSQGGTLIHESSHFLATASTQDYVYGQTAAKSLAKSNSAEAIENADSHEYFAENNPSQA
ncbi:peptidyl-Lys metalloendopeptidase [Mycena filopes]|nr:peptidyl-Lys metalloendopeptidase [Mycena filopes]